MRNILFALCLLSGSVVEGLTSASVVGEDKGTHHLAQHQALLLPQPNVVMPTDSDDDHNNPGDVLGDVVISDVIGRSRSTNIFAGLTRGVDGVAERFANSSANSTVLAPLNSAITALSRKPWEDPTDYAIMGQRAYDGQAGVDRAATNLKRFVEAHIVPVSPWKEGEKVRSLAGEMLWWKRKDDGTIVVSLEQEMGGRRSELSVKKVLPSSTEIRSVAQKVVNGEVWMIESVLDYPKKG